MQHEQIDELLKRTLSDFRLSRGEKRIVAGLVEEAERAGFDVDFLRHRAFALARKELRDPEGKKTVDWLEDVIKVLRPRPPEELPRPRVYFSPAGRPTETRKTSSCSKIPVSLANSLRCSSGSGSSSELDRGIRFQRVRHDTIVSHGQAEACTPTTHHTPY